MALPPNEVESRVRAFEQAVATHFADLEGVHGFTRHRPRITDVDEPRDAAVSIRFHRPDLAIDIGLALYGDRAGLVIRDPRWHLKPKPHRKAINLDALIAPAKAQPSPSRSDAGLEAEVARIAHRFRQVATLVLQPEAAILGQIAADGHGG